LLAGADFVEKYERSNDFYVVSRLETPGVLNRFSWKSWFSIILLALMILFVSIGLFSMLEAMALAVVLLLITKIVNAEEIMKDMQYDVLLIIASSLGIGAAMTKTGLADTIASGLITVGEPFGIIGIVIIFYALTNIFTEFITNSAAAVLMLPIGLELAHTLHLDPMGFAILVTIAASASFMTPIGYQTNLIVYGPGGYTFFDYVRIGTPLSLLVMVTAITVIYTIWF
jgi:di/tricarboxylate transporter